MIYADKGYSSENNRNVLAEKELNNGIMDKAVRNKPLTLIQIVINRLISSILYTV